MNAREEMRRFGHCTMDPDKHVKDERAFWAGVQKKKRLMRHKDIREEVAFVKMFPDIHPRRQPTADTPYVFCKAGEVGFDPVYMFRVRGIGMALVSFVAELMRPAMYFLYLIFIKKLEIEEPSNLYFAAGVELFSEAFLFNVALSYIIYS